MLEYTNDHIRWDMKCYQMELKQIFLLKREVNYDRFAGRGHFVRHTCADAMDACTYPGTQMVHDTPEIVSFTRQKILEAKNDDGRVVVIIYK